MKILLLQDVRKIGKKGEIVDVNDGYARNFVLPRKLGKVATSGDQKVLEQKNKKQEEGIAKRAEEYNQILDILKDTKVSMKVNANDKGGLFSSLKKEEILGEISKAVGENIPSELLKSIGDIKEVGVHPIKFVFEKREVVVELEVIS